MRVLEGGLRLLTQGYRAALSRALAAPVFVLLLALLASGGSFLLYRSLPQELVPSEDRGVFFIPVTAPQGATVAYTDAEVRKVEKIVTPLRTDGEAERIFAIVGRGSEPHRAFVVVRLADWGERARTQQEIVRSLIPALGQISGARAFPVNPAGLGLRGSRTPLRVVVGGPDYESVKQWSAAIMQRAEENPGLLNVETDFEENQPQFDVQIDRAKADDLDIGVESIAQTLQTLLASREITTYVDRGREYPVIVQARAEDRRTPTDLANIFVRSGTSGELTPLTALVTLSEGAAAPALRRYDRLPSVTISASLADGYDLGSAVRYMQQIAAETLPPEANLGFSGQSQQFLETSGGVAVTFALALLIVFLVLAAQFESFMHPLIIMLSVPLAVTGALLSLVAHRQFAQHLQPDRDHPVDRPDGQERHPDRRVRQPAARSGPPGARGDPRGLGAALPPDRDDRGVDHPGRGAARHRDRRRSREPQRDRHRRDRRARHRLNPYPVRHPGALRPPRPLHPLEQRGRTGSRGRARGAQQPARRVSLGALSSCHERETKRTP